MTTCPVTVQMNSIYAWSLKLWPLQCPHVCSKFRHLAALSHLGLRTSCFSCLPYLLLLQISSPHLCPIGCHVLYSASSCCMLHLACLPHLSLWEATAGCAMLCDTLKPHATRSYRTKGQVGCTLLVLGGRRWQKGGH